MEKMQSMSKAERNEYIDKNDVRDIVASVDTPRFIEM